MATPTGTEVASFLWSTDISVTVKNKQKLRNYILYSM
jgi:hypothetical protein